MRNDLALFRIRHKNVQILVAKFGGIKNLAAKIQKDSAQVGAFSSENPTVSISDSIAELIEKKCRLKKGWMSVPHVEEERKYLTPSAPASRATLRLLGMINGFTEEDMEKVFKVVEKIVATKNREMEKLFKLTRFDVSSPIIRKDSVAAIEDAIAKTKMRQKTKSAPVTKKAAKGIAAEEKATRAKPVKSSAVSKAESKTPGKSKAATKTASKQTAKSTVKATVKAGSSSKKAPAIKKTGKAKSTTKLSAADQVKIDRLQKLRDAALKAVG